MGAKLKLVFTHPYRYLPCEIIDFARLFQFEKLRSH